MDANGLNSLKDAVMIAARSTANKMLAEKIGQQMIPLAEGTLQNIKTDVDDRAAKHGKISIVTQGPYAARLYWHPEYDFNHEFNPNAQGEWWEDYLTGDKAEKPAKLFKYFYKKAAGGYVT